MARLDLYVGGNYEAWLKGGTIKLDPELKVARDDWVVLFDAEYHFTQHFVDEVVTASEGKFMTVGPAIPFNTINKIIIDLRQKVDADG